MKGGLVIALGAVLWAASPARAQNAEDEARQLFERGRQLADQERWGEALEYLRRARARSDRPVIVLNIGICLFTLGRHVEATEALAEFLRRAGADADPVDVQRARRMEAQSRAAIATLVLHVSPGSAAAGVDGRPRPGTGGVRTILLDPGEHMIRLSAQGYLAGNGRISLLPGQRAEQTIALRRLDEPAPARARPERESAGILSSPIFWLVTGAVVVGAGIGIALAVSEPGTEAAVEGNLPPYVITTAWDPR